jgi:predicted nucleic acid-binding protein
MFIFISTFVQNLPAAPEGGCSPLSPLPIAAPEQSSRAFLSPNPERSLEAARKLLDSLVVLPLDDEATIVFGALAARLRSEGRRIGDFDEVIASIALDSIREMVARDGNVGEVAEIKVVGW